VLNDLISVSTGQRAQSVHSLAFNCTGDHTGTVTAGRAEISDYLPSDVSQDVIMVQITDKINLR
jgi:hypothetical protein